MIKSRIQPRCQKNWVRDPIVAYQCWGGSFFEDSNLLLLGFGQEWRDLSYQNTATKMCSQPSQATKMREAQRLHLIDNHIPKKEFPRSPNPKATPIQGTFPDLSPPEKAPTTHNHSQTQSNLQLPKNTQCTTMSKFDEQTPFHNFANAELQWSHRSHNCIPLLRLWNAEGPVSHPQKAKERKSFNLNIEWRGLSYQNTAMCKNVFPAILCYKRPQAASTVTCSNPSSNSQKQNL